MPTGRIDRQAARRKATTAGIPCVKACTVVDARVNVSQKRKPKTEPAKQSASVIFRRIILPFISFVVSDRAPYCGTRNTVVTSHVSGDTADNSSFYATRRVGRANGY